MKSKIIQKQSKQKKAEKSKITVFGSGYVGLVTAVCFAEIGYDVICVDIDQKKIACLKKGKSPFFEKGLDKLLKKNLAAKQITFTSNLKQAILHGDFLFIAVGTPSATYGSADLQYVYNVAKEIGKFLTKPAIVINKSTVPVGTSDRVRSIIEEELQKRGVDVLFNMISNPEFLKQGDAIKDFMQSDRVIIGADDLGSLHAMQQLYNPLKTQIISMDIRSAELSKYAANAFLATKISFINEIAMLAEKFDADIEQIRLGIGTDPRIGLDFLRAGCGYGGSCFPKDVKALIWMAKEMGHEVPLFDAVENINIRQKCLIFNRLRKYFGNEFKNKTICLWGLAFKPETDDMRDAPSKVLLELLWHEGVKVRAYDPVAMHEANKIYGDRDDFVLCKSAADALDGADALAIVTEWQEFRNPDFALIKKKLSNAVIFDGRNLFDPIKMKQLDINYYCVGRGRNYYEYDWGSY